MRLLRFPVPFKARPAGKSVKPEPSFVGVDANFPIPMLALSFNQAIYPMIDGDFSPLASHPELPSIPGFGGRDRGRTCTDFSTGS